MSNPVTQKLMEQIADRRLERFVAWWDALEELVIRVYRGQQAAPADEKDLRKLRGRLGKAYRGYAGALTPYWQATTIQGEALTDDPFLALLAIQSAADFVDNWPAMQTLPATRQALNEWLVDQVSER